MNKRIPTQAWYAVAGVGLSALTGVGGYFLGARRQMAQLEATIQVYKATIKVLSEPKQASTEKLAKGLPGEIEEYEPGVYRPVIDPNQDHLDDLFKKYGPHFSESHNERIVEFERQAQPLADEILGLTDAVELVPEDYEDYEILEEYEPVATIHNIFASTSSDDDWNMEEEQANRTSDRPYVIHQDEFIDKESGFDQSTLTYYAGDGVVADELNTPVDDWVSLLGQLQWGHGTTNANAVYIRNEKRQHEFEVLLATGSYLEEVMSEETLLAIEQDELKHSMTRRFRED